MILKYFFQKIVQALSDIYHSFFNNEKGMAARKLSAFASISIAIYATTQHTTDGNICEMVIIWLTFCALCLSVVTVENIIKFKDAGKNENS